MKGSGYGPLMDILLGIVGAIVGGWIMRALGFYTSGGLIPSILVAILGRGRRDTNRTRPEKSLISTSPIPRDSICTRSARALWIRRKSDPTGQASPHPDRSRFISEPIAVELRTR